MYTLKTLNENLNLGVICSQPQYMHSQHMSSIYAY